MSKCLVTGAAGFIGSHLSERLVASGHEVVGVDCYVDYYSRSDKRRNLTHLRASPSFSLVDADLVETNIGVLLDGVDYVFHLAGQPGIRASWGNTFDVYVRNNVIATQRLLEAAKGRPITKVLFASSSSIYGDAEDFPTRESALPKPVSPYGVTKLAAEQLMYLYWRNFEIPTVALRYFTVYGPRQRPDMAFHRFIRAGLADEPVTVFGDGHQTRDYTYVGDAVDGTLRAAFGSAVGEAFNLGGGSRVSVKEVLGILSKLIGRPFRIDEVAAQRGDARHTMADISRAREMLGYQPTCDIATGLQRELEWVESIECEPR